MMPGCLPFCLLSFGMLIRLLPTPSITLLRLFLLLGVNGVLH
jgi:hypothetical protein